MSAASVTVMIPPRGEVGTWLVEELADLAGLGLVRDAYVIRAGDAEHPLVCSIARPDDPPVDLLDLLAVGEESDASVQIVHVVLAGGDGPTVDPQMVRSRLELLLGERPVHGLNLVIPTEDTGDAATVSAGSLIPSWTNLVASPEDNLSATLPSKPVEVGASYLPHATAAVASAASLWASMDGSPFAEKRTDFTGPDGHGDDGRGVIVFRSRSRSVLAGRPVDSIAARSLHTAPPDQPSYVGVEMTTPYPDPDTLLDGVAARFGDVADRVLRFRVVAPEKAQLARYTGLIGLLRYLIEFTTKKLPEIVVDHAAESIGAFSDAIARRIQERFLGGDGSIFRLRFFPGALQGEEVPDDFDAIGQYLGGHRAQWPYEAPRMAWRQLVSLSTGLADGALTGDAETDETLDQGPIRSVLADRTTIVGPPADQPPVWAIAPDLARHLGWDPETWRRNDARRIRRARDGLELLLEHPESIPHGVSVPDVQSALDSVDAATARHRPALHWRIADTLAGEIEDAIDVFESMEEALAETDATDGEPTCRRGFKRVLLYTVLLAVAVAVAIAFPLAVIAYLIILLVLGLSWLTSVAFTILGWWRDRWVERTRRRAAQTYRSWASEQLEAVLAEIYRLNANYAQFLDLSEYLGALSDDPFGPAAAYQSESPRLHSRGLVGHQTANGLVTPGKFRGAVRRQARRLYNAGWLGSVVDGFGEAGLLAFRTDFGLERDQVRPVTDDPFIRHDLRAGEEQSSRVYLRDRARDSEARFHNRIRAWRALRAEIAAAPITEVLDWVDGRERPPAEGPNQVAAFLAEAVAPAPKTTFLGSIWTDQVGPGTVASLQWIPPGITGAGDARASAVDPDELMVQAVAIEWCERVAAADLRILAPGTCATVAPDRLVPSRRKVEGPVDRVDAGSLRRQRSATMRRLDEFGPGSVVAPSVDVVEPPEAGTYAFRSEVDGEPFRFPNDQPISFLVRDVGGPANALSLIRESLQEISNASGYRFEFVDFTTDYPTPGQRSGTDLWIGWIFPEEEERFLSGEAIGLGGSAGVHSASGDALLHTASAKVRAELDLPATFGPNTIGSVLLHELGHALNLAHVDDTAEVMYPGSTPVGPDTLGPGDRRALWLLANPAPRE